MPLNVGVLSLAILVAAWGWSSFRLPRPRAMASIVDAVKRHRQQLDVAAVPAATGIEARDRTPLIHRFYASPAPSALCLLIHGSSANSMSMHAVASALQAAGFSVASLDVRGHGGSGERGHIRYFGQLEDDLSDILDHFGSRFPDLPIGLVGFSSGGGFALRMAGTPSLANRLAFFIALSPMISARSRTYRRDAGGWVRVSVARILAIEALNMLGVRLLNRTTVLRFGLDDAAIALDGATPAYSYSLQKNFGLPLRFEPTLAQVSGRTHVLVGQADSLFMPDQYKPEIQGINPHIEVETIEGMDHIDMIHHPVALDRLVRTAMACISV